MANVDNATIEPTYMTNPSHNDHELTSGFFASHIPHMLRMMAAMHKGASWRRHGRTPNSKCFSCQMIVPLMIRRFSTVNRPLSWSISMKAAPWFHRLMGM